MMNKAQILPIPREMIGEMWPHVSPRLFIGLTVARETTLEKLADNLVSGDDTLWTIIEAGKVAGAFVTATFLDEDSDEPFLGVYALGGKGLQRWGRQLGDAMIEHAKHTGAASVRFSGRDAWSRVLPAYQIKGRRYGGEAIFERKVA